jgi:hypothetical protein
MARRAEICRRRLTGTTGGGRYRQAGHDGQQTAGIPERPVFHLACSSSAQMHPQQNNTPNHRTLVAWRRALSGAAVAAARKERRDAGIKHEVTDWLTLSGLLELDRLPAQQARWRRCASRAAMNSRTNRPCAADPRLPGG